MNQSKHSPRPWVISHGGMPGDSGWSLKSNNTAARLYVVAECWPPRLRDEQREELLANMRLVMAGPRMETALARILVLIQQGVSDEDLEFIEEECREALGAAWGVSAAEVTTPDLEEMT